MGGGLVCHGSAGQNTMDKGVKIPWIGDSTYHGSGSKYNG